MIAATSGAAALLVATSRPPSLSASPARVTLSGAESRTIRVTNSGGGVATVDVAPAGLEDALALKGWSPVRVDAYRIVVRALAGAISFRGDQRSAPRHTAIVAIGTLD